MNEKEPKDNKKSPLAEFDKDEGFSKCKIVLHENGAIELEPLQDD